MWKFVGLFSLLINTGFVGWEIFRSVASDPELANKQEWSILETLEAKNRKTTSNTNVIIETNYMGSGYDAFGILDPKLNRWIWIMGNAKNVPMIKILPEIQNLIITTDQLDELSKNVKMNLETRQFVFIKRS